MSKELPISEPLIRFDPPPAAMRGRIERIDALRNSYAAAVRGGAVLTNVIDATRIELTYHSNAIEGNTLSLRETQLVLEGRVPPGERDLREIYEARNHDRAVRLVEQWVVDRPADSPITRRDLLDLHALVLADIQPTAGQFRAHRVLIAGSSFVPPGSHRFDTLIPAALELAGRRDAHVAIRATELHYNFAAIHPFGDGNGRTARLLMNYVLLREGFPHAIIEVERRSQYLNAFDRANAGEWVPFAEFILDAIERSFSRAMGLPNSEP